MAVDGDEEVLTWLPGRTEEGWFARPGDLDELARIVRQLHDLTADLAPGFECLVHDDLQPRNVLVDGDRLALIDWEQLRPGDRVEDVSQLCWSFAGPGDDEAIESVADRWARVLDAYGLADRTQVVAAASTKVDRCVGDILRLAEQGSSRHQGFLQQGHHDELGRVAAWLGTNGTKLSKMLG